MASGTVAVGACKGSESVTHGVRVFVTPEYEGWQQVPSLAFEDSVGGHYVFAYRIRIVNESDVRVQLLRRRWLIIDCNGSCETVEGDGVVGEQPVLGPGEAYEYGSWCRLGTDWGTMEGCYEMLAETGALVYVNIGRFFLVADTDGGRES